MPQTKNQKDKSTREWIDTCYVEVNKTANLNTADIDAAVNSVDATMDMTAGSINAGQTLKQAILSRLPEPFKSMATQNEKFRVLIAWAKREAGL